MKRVIEIPEESIELLKNKSDLTIAESILTNSVPLTDFVSDIHEIPENFYYDTETNEFYVYRHRYTGKEIHILKEPETFRFLGRYPAFRDSEVKTAIHKVVSAKHEEVRKWVGMWDIMEGECIGFMESLHKLMDALGIEYSEDEFEDLFS